MHINRWSLKALRQAAGQTVSGLAAASGIKQPHLSNIEKGVRRASDEVIVALAKALDVPVQAIITCPIEDIAA